MKKIRCFVCSSILDLDEFIKHLDFQHPEFDHLVKFYNKLSTDEFISRMKNNNLIEDYNERT